MRKHHFVLEEPAPPSPEQAEFQANMCVLTPIRENRLTKAERAWRKEKRHLAQLKQRLIEQASQLEQRREDNTQKLQKLSESYRYKKVSQQSLSLWIEQEKQLLMELETMTQQLNEMRLEVEQQQQQVAHAKQQVDRHHLDNERLKILIEKIEEAL